MKTFITAIGCWLLALCFVAGCKPSAQVCHNDTVYVTKTDTLYLPSQAKYDTLYIPGKGTTDTVYVPIDGGDIRKNQLLDSLSKQVFVARYKLERVKYYLKIAQRNPSQTKFLKSWISRAVN
jgi:hypothetical protein